MPTPTDLPPVQERYDVPDMLRLAKKLHDRRVITSCMTCSHFNEQTEICEYYMRRPPARIIAFGCESWDDEALINYITSGHNKVG